MWGAILTVALQLVSWFLDRAKVSKEAKEAFFKFVEQAGQDISSKKLYKYAQDQFKELEATEFVPEPGQLKNPVQPTRGQLKVMQNEKRRKLLGMTKAEFKKHIRKITVVALLLAPLQLFADTQETDFWVHHAREVIEDVYGDKVRAKPKDLLKFGQNSDVDGPEETVMEFINDEVSETYIETNLIDAVVSNNASNTMQVTIEGMTCTGSGTSVQRTFVVQTITLTGQTEAPLTTPLCRATRVYNSSSTELQASSFVYVYQDSGTVTAGVPQDDTLVHVIMSQAGKDNTSNKAATAFSNKDYFAVTQIYIGIDEKTSAKCDFKLKVRLPGKVFRTVIEKPLDNTGSSSVTIDVRPYIILPKNSDVILTATCSTTNVSVSGGFNGLLMLVQD